MEQTRIHLIVFLLFFIIALSGKNTNGEIVSYARHPVHHYIPPTTGWGRLTVWECLDNECNNNCEIMNQQDQYFGHCQTIPNCPGKSQRYRCSYWGASVIIQVFNNPHCDGTAATVIRTDGCYSQDYIDGGSNNNNGQCDYDGDRDEPLKYYKYNCWLEEANFPLRTIEDEEETSVVNMNIGIAIGVLLFVCMIGVIAGYLIHTKRKQSAQEKLLCDTNHEDQSSA